MCGSNSATEQKFFAIQYAKTTKKNIYLTRLNAPITDWPYLH